MGVGKVWGAVLVGAGMFFLVLMMPIYFLVADTLSPAVRTPFLVAAALFGIGGMISLLLGLKLVRREG